MLNLLRMRKKTVLDLGPWLSLLVLLRTSFYRRRTPRARRTCKASCTSLSKSWKMGGEEVLGVTTGQPNLFKQDLSKLVSYDVRRAASARCGLTSFSRTMAYLSRWYLTVLKFIYVYIHFHVIIIDCRKSKRYLLYKIHKKCKLTCFFGIQNFACLWRLSRQRDLGSLYPTSHLCIFYVCIYG